MDLTSPKTIRALFKEHNIRPSKSLGQHFLVNRGALMEMIETAGLDAGDVVLEIGPGPGTLTVELAKRTKKVFAIERDKRMARILNEVLRREQIENVEVMEGDILKISNFKFLISNKIPNPKSQIPNKTNKPRAKSYKLVSNLPYQITSQVFEKFLEKRPRPESITVMIQKEVAERVIAKKGNMSMLSAAVQFFGKPKIVSFVPRINFWPEPNVDSCILHVGAIHELPLQDDDIRSFFNFVRIGFFSRRKMLKNNMASGFKVAPKQAESWLKDAKLKKNTRAQELSVEDWLRLFGIFRRNREKVI